MPATIATIIAVSTDAMILFHSQDDIAALRLCRAVALQPADCAGPAENRIPAGNSTELSRFRRADEPGILSLSFRPKPPIRPVSAAPQNPIVMIPARLAAG